MSKGKIKFPVEDRLLIVFPQLFESGPKVPVIKPSFFLHLYFFFPSLIWSEMIRLVLWFTILIYLFLETATKERNNPSEDVWGYLGDLEFFL